MVGHIVVPKKEVDVTAGFAGAKGNLIWFNSGNTDLILNLRGENLKKSIILEPGFGFCIGKRKKYTQVFLSAIDRASSRFEVAEKGIVVAHALFFGCDMGDRDTWLGELNATDLAQEWITEGSLFSYKVEKTSERIHRLGLEIKNFKKNWIRIAPMKSSKIP